MDNKIKAQWMAQYLGQSIINKPYTGFPPSEKDFFTENGKFMYVYCDRQRYWCFSVLNNDSLGNPKDEFSKQPIEDGCLLLRTVDMLTDEEVKAVANIYGWGGDMVTKDRFDERVLQFKIDLPCIEKQGYHHRHMKFVFDYLIRIGVLLSFTYLNDLNQPVTLTSAEIIALGWAKIKI